MSNVFRRLPRGVLALIALSSLAAVGFALVSQHAFGMKPCPWCIFQRVLLLTIALAAGLGWLAKPRGVTLASATAVLALSLGGVAAALYQHQVASLDSSCAFTFADRFLSATGLEAAVPYLFQVTATCMEAASYKLLGIAFEIWSGALFVLLALAALAVLRGALAAPPKRR